MRLGFLRSRTMVALWALLGAGCAQDSTPSVPTAPGPQASTVTLTGMVVDDAGAPVREVRVSAFPVTGWTGAWAVAPAITESSGRFSLGLPRHDGPVYVIAYKDGYFQPCPAAVSFPLETTVTVPMTSGVVTNGLPVVPNLRQVSGVVSETTAVGSRPLQGASVGWEIAFLGSVAAYAQTDEQGRYRLCGLPRTPIDNLYVSWGRKYLHASAEAGGDAVVDFHVEP